MLIKERVRQLGRVEHDALKDAVLALAEPVWHEDDLRRWQPERVDVQSVVLVFCDGWQPIRIERKSGWPHLNEQVIPLASDIISRHYTPGGRLLRAMVARLVAGGTISLHLDKHPSFAVAHRIHVPLQTNQGVEFTVDEERVIMEEGKAYELNNLLPHGVYNGGEEDRIHLIFDYMAPQ
jgi:hypothetical protein